MKQVLEKWECTDWDTCNGAFLVDKSKVDSSKDLICPYCGGVAESVAHQNADYDFEDSVIDGLNGCLWPQGPNER